MTLGGLGMVFKTEVSFQSAKLDGGMDVFCGNVEDVYVFVQVHFFTVPLQGLEYFRTTLYV